MVHQPNHSQPHHIIIFTSYHIIIVGNRSSLLIDRLIRLTPSVDPSAPSFPCHHRLLGCINRPPASSFPLVLGLVDPSASSIPRPPRSFSPSSASAVLDRISTASLLDHIVAHRPRPLCCCSGCCYSASWAIATRLLGLLLLGFSGCSSLV